MPSPFYPASVVLFQLYGGIVSHMQALATPPQLYTKLNTWIDRHLDITFGLQVVDSLVSVVFKVLNHPYIFFFHLLVNGSSVTCFHTFSKTYLLLIDGRYCWTG